MYKIIGADKKEYGPVSADQIHRWISEGRVNGQTLVQAAGDSSWKQLSTVAEFTESLRVQNEPFNTPPPPAPGQVNLPMEEIVKRDYQLDIGGCVSRGWSVFKENMGVIMAAFLVWIVITVAVGGIIGVFTRPFLKEDHVAMSIVFRMISIPISAVVAGPLLGGFYWVILLVIRKRPGGVGEIFSGFQKAFLQLFLGYLVIQLLLGLCFLPFTIAVESKLNPLLQAMEHMQNASQSDIQDMVTELISVFKSNLLLLFVCAIPVIYLTVSWRFALPLIVDKNLSFGRAMGASWKMVNKHWWTVFGLSIVASLINVLGLLCCCVGLLFTIPLGFVIMMCGYEVIFSQSDGKTH